MLRTRLIAGSGAATLLSLVFGVVMTGVHSGGKLIQAVLGTRANISPSQFLGPLGLYVLVALLIVSYLRFFIPSRGALLRTQAGVLGIVAMSLASSKLLVGAANLSPFVIPSAIVPLWVALYLDRRAAILLSVATGFLLALLVRFSMLTFMVYVACGMSAAFSFRGRKHSRATLLAGVAAGLFAAITLVVGKTFEGEFDVRADLFAGVRSEVLAAFAGGVASGVVSVLVEPLAVVVLGVVSRARLLDLTDLEQPLLQKMAKEAPGSWEHSRAMANLAEGAAAAIGADALLTRVGAYYHDLGKTIQPKYFVENLEHGERSPHEELEPHVSADAIMAHVVEGVNILRRGGIPESVIEFAYTHHGTSVIEYFWHKCIEQGNPNGLKESFFRYPGMRPRSKETAILMLIDSIEAASRTVNPPERAKFEELIQRIIFVKMKQGQLDESGLTVEDLRTLVNRVTDTLTNVYHGRVRYPWQDRRAKGQSDLPIPGVLTEKEAQAAHAPGERRSVAPPPPKPDDPGC